MINNNLANCPKCGSTSLSSTPIGLRRKRQRTTCLNCGFQFDPTYKRRLGKQKKALLIFAIVFVIIVAIAAINKNFGNLDTDSSNQSQAKVNVIFNSSEYNKISPKELAIKMGKAKGEEWNNETSKGTFKMKIYDYTKDDIYYTFIFNENKLVKLYYQANKGTLKYDDFDTMIESFGLKYESKKEIVDNNITAKYDLSGSDAQRFEIHGVDKDKKTFEMVRVTFDNSFFEAE